MARGGESLVRDLSAALLFALLLIFAHHTEAADEQADGSASADAEYQKVKGDALDAYIAGRLITAFALSEHLSPFGLGVDVKDGRVMLSGIVETAVQRDLAVEIARGIEQASAVDSEIEVDPQRARAAQPGSHNRFAQMFADASITARVKTRLLVNGSTQGLAIDVDTERNMVQLSGEVDSGAVSALAEQIARNTYGVAAVDNRLDVTPAPGVVSLRRSAP